MSIPVWAVGCGVLAGVVFILDGWRPPKPGGMFAESPRIRGMMFCLGTGLLPTFQVFATDDPLALELYGLTWVLTTLLLVVGLAGYAMVVAAPRIKRNTPQLTWMEAATDALPLVSVAVDAGIQGFNDAIAVQAHIVGQRDLAIDFLLGFQRATTRMLGAQLTESQFVDQVTIYLEAFALNLLERDHVLSKYRACVYRLSEDGSALDFVTGVSPTANRHSRASLPLDSLAGLALSNPGRVWQYPAPNGSNVPFHARSGGQTYKAVLAKAVESTSGDDNHADWVLCVDCTDDNIKGPGEFAITASFAFADSLGHARKIAGL